MTIMPFADRRHFDRPAHRHWWSAELLLRVLIVLASLVPLAVAPLVRRIALWPKWG